MLRPNPSCLHSNSATLGDTAEKCEVAHLNWFDGDIGVLDSVIKPSQRLRVVAGDVLYKAALIAPFFRIVKLLLAASEGSEMLLCHVPRFVHGIYCHVLAFQ